MKNNKKIVLALGAAGLGLVAATGVTSGFAWFAANATATVTGAQIAAKSNQPFLLIGSGTKTLTQLRSDKAIAQTSTINSELYPVTPNTTVMTDYTIDKVEATDAWQYRYSKSTSENVDLTNATNITLPQTDYVAVAEFSLGLAAESSAVDGLFVSSITYSNAPTGGNYEGLKIIISTEANGHIFTTSVAYSETATDDNKIWTTQILPTADTVVKVKAYLFLDGTYEGVDSDEDGKADTGVFSVNKAKLGGTVGFTINTFNA